MCTETASRIADGQVIGWYQGRMEWGARALGNRSILADPRRRDMRDIINQKIKFRERFRPFAPSVLAESIDQYFVGAVHDPFMIQVYPVRPDKRETIPAVTHVDGSGRLQSVSAREQPALLGADQRFSSENRRPHPAEHVVQRERTHCRAARTGARLLPADRHGSAGDGPAPVEQAAMTDGTAAVRVCYFNRSYWPDTGATGQLLTELAEDLASVHGMDVTVITGYPLAQDDHAVASSERRNGVRVLRARGTTFPTRTFAGRATNYVTYFLSALWIALRLPRQDVAVALTDPPIIGLAALAARPRRGMVFFCQDIFPEVAGLLSEDFHSPLVNNLLDWVNRFLLRRAVRVVVLGDTMASRLIHGKGADAAKMTVIHNWADTTAIVPSPKDNPFARAHGLHDRFVVLHAGNIGLSQNLDVVIDAAAALQSRPDIVFLFIGDGQRRPALEAAARARGLDGVRFLPFQPRDQLRWTYASSDVCLVSLKPGLAGYIVPSKLYPILAAGRPVHRGRRAVERGGSGDGTSSVRRARGTGRRSGPGLGHCPPR